MQLPKERGVTDTYEEHEKGIQVGFQGKGEFEKEIIKNCQKCYFKTKAEEQIGKTTHRDYRNSIDQRGYLKSKVHNLECVIYEVYAM